MLNQVPLSEAIMYIQQKDASALLRHAPATSIDLSLPLTSPNSFHQAQYGEITFLRRNWLRRGESHTSASLVLTDDAGFEPMGSQAVLHLENPRFWFAKLCQAYFSSSELEVLRPAHEVIPELSARGRIGIDCQIAESVLLNSQITIGDNTIIQAGTVIYGNTHIQANANIGPLAVIGKSGFAFEKWNGETVLLPHYGGVCISERVRIGAHSCIDRGTFGMTEIQADVMIDNLVHVAHNAKIQSSSLIVAGAVLCGSVDIGRDVWIGAGALIRESLTVGDGALVGMGAVVVQSIASGLVVVGNPAREIDAR